MPSQIVNVGATPVELPRASATSLLIQNQSDRRYVRLVVAATQPEVTAAGPLREPMSWGRMADLTGGDKVWAWSIGSRLPSSDAAPVLVEQEA